MGSPVLCSMLGACEIDCMGMLECRKCRHRLTDRPHALQTAFQAHAMLLNTLPEDKLSAEVLAAVQSVMKQLSSDNFQDGVTPP